jgi:hypothetical protein
MVIGDYNRQKHAPIGVDQDNLEKWLANFLEPKAAISIEKLRTRPNELTWEDIAYLVVYLDHQRAYVPRQLEIVKNVAISMLLNRVPHGSMDPEFCDAIARGEITINITEDFRFNVMMMASGLFARFFLNMAWQVVKAEEGCSFITSDNPVTFIHPDFSYPFEPGIALTGTHVVFPLDSQYLLIMSHPEYKCNTALPPLEPISDRVLADGRIDNIHEKQFPEELVNLTNSIILKHSHRVIVGSNKDTLEKAINPES